MTNVKNGRMFSAEFNKATEVNSQTRLLAQTPNEPVEYVDLEQVADVVNEGMLSDQEAAKTYATKTGEYKELTAGFAYEILGDGQATREKFSFRPTGGPNRNVRDGSARIEVLKGNSVVWNQLVDADTTSVTLTANHKYITNIDGTISIQSPTSATTINVEGGVDKVTDLTQMFGAGNEPATVEQFYELLPEGVDINTYNVGEIVDANYKAIETTGFNQWDEHWESGNLASTTGLPTGEAGSFRSKNFIKVFPNTDYYMTTPPEIAKNVRWFFYDINKQFISRQFYGNVKVKTPNNAFYIKFVVNDTPTYNNDICLNIAWDEYSALNGQYKPYKPFERDLSWVNKYFPATINGETKYGMRSAGNAHDEIRFNSTTQQWEAVQKIGAVDLGSINWTYSTNVYGNGGAGFIAYVSGAKFSNTDIVKGNILSSTYSTVSAYTQVVGQDRSIACYNAFNTRIVVIDSAYTDAASFKAAMAGVMLNYELAKPIITPITEDVNLAYDVSDYGTEQLIVAEGAQSAPLSAEVVYEPNVLASIKQVAAMLTRLDALETAVATMQASAVATTNEE